MSSKQLLCPINKPKEHFYLYFYKQFFKNEQKTHCTCVLFLFVLKTLILNN